ncbi:MAG: hypothetical protein CSA35_02170 [Dethiosulfovibrio peptidovorans]|nr:MAG: hypothetical protein CSA35_02170 [Dethiosulfovibrio peptidovorans]
MLAGTLLREVRETFDSRVRIDVYDPRCPLWFWDVMRFSVRGGEPTWVIDGRRCFRGIPSWDELRDALMEALRKRA